MPSSISNLRWTAYVLAYLVVHAAVAMADTATISNNTSGAHTGTYSGTIDGRINQGSATTNYGSSSTGQIAKYGTGDENDILIAFTGLSNITGPVTVTSITLGMNLSSHGGGSSQTATIYRVLQNWVEAQFTWNIYSTGNNWNTAGASGSGTDRAASSSGTFTMGITDGVFDTVTDNGGQLCTDVQNWINGVNPNYGWILERTDGSGDSTYRTYDMKDSSNTLRPYLDVTYTVGSATTFFHKRRIQ